MFNILDLENLTFEWDEKKEAINFNKHGIRFSTAVKVFKDPHLLIHEDTEHSKELRYDVLGKVNKILFVVCMLKEKNTVRLISARIANKTEKERYLNYDQDEI